MKNANNATAKSIPLGKMNAEGSNLMKDAEIAWDNLIPHDGHGGPFVNAGIERETEPASHYRKQADVDD